MIHRPFLPHTPVTGRPIRGRGAILLLVSALLAACGSEPPSHLAGGGVITDNTLSIRVTTPDGLPAARATVSCRDFEITAQGESLGQARTASADDSGRVTLPCVARRGTAVEALSPDGASLAFTALPPDVDSAELHLDQAVALQGRLEHLAGAWIGIPGLGRGARIDASGHFLLQDVPAGLRELAIVSGTQAAYLDLRLHPGVVDRISLPAIAPEAARPDPRWGAGLQEVRLVPIPALDTAERSGIEILDEPGGQPLQTGLPDDWALVEDFGLGGISRMSSINGGTYYYFADSTGGTPDSTVSWGHVPREPGTAKIFTVTAGHGATWANLGISLGGKVDWIRYDARDLAGMRAIRFKARGTGSWTLQVLPGGQNLTGATGDPHEQPLAIAEDWRDFRIPVEELPRRSDGAPLAVGVNSIQAIQFHVDLAGLVRDSSVRIEVDDIVLEGVRPGQLRAIP